MVKIFKRGSVQDKTMLSQFCCWLIILAQRDAVDVFFWIKNGRSAEGITRAARFVRPQGDAKLTLEIHMYGVT